MDISDRLKAARKHANLTQLELARAAGVDQSVISNIERRIAGGSKKLPEMAAACRVNIDWLTLGRGSMTSSPHDTANTSHATEEASVDYKIIPQYTAVGACGEGLLSEHSEINGGLTFKTSWLTKKGLKPENLHVIYADGSSMEPYIFSGDVVLFDSSDTEPRHNQVYVIRRPDGSLSIKRLALLVSGKWLIKSDNSDYESEEASAETISTIPIVGRVIWRGGDIF